ncbi:maleylpyruvate isomerase family mycothiol-dependent enzyme [Kocuria rosea]|uniref:maleylpyruvate isomerase family mycothiol-dependent enzyme n=1 Tax=Kocuria rosea TaxID=1275 RepID=UPI00203B0717|nr:maleylpyruvate isomerase family mycothiol-dependent enzyme [Kocuria rosea]MCM3689031.1 maleylpyruvate isomerase family mycothiol-dependent enzyme [Kocuria rosea]
MTSDGRDIEGRVDTERTRLVGVLQALDEEQWRTPSLCAGWSVRDLVVHLLMPYELSTPQFLGLMLRSRFNFDRAADRWATTDRRTPPQVLTALDNTAHRKFNVPGAPPEAPLSHLVIHAQDVYRPLGVPSPTDPHNAAIALEELTGPRGRKALTPGLLENLAFVATDTDWRHGAGQTVTGPAVALLATIAGRQLALSDLSGPGVQELSRRLEAVNSNAQ